MQYIVVQGEGHEIMQALQALERAVNDKTKDGYNPIGSLIVTNFEKHGEKVVSQKVTKVLLLQPMFKNKESKPFNMETV